MSKQKNENIHHGGTERRAEINRKGQERQGDEGEVGYPITTRWDQYRKG